MTTNSFAHHRVLPHQHNSFSTQRHPDLLHLLGSHVVCSHNETFWVIIQELLQQNKHYNYTKKFGAVHRAALNRNTLKRKKSEKSENAELQVRPGVPYAASFTQPSTPIPEQVCKRHGKFSGGLIWTISYLFLVQTPHSTYLSLLKAPTARPARFPLPRACPGSAPRGLRLDTHDDFHKIVGLPRSPVFPGHLGGAPRIARWV